MAQGKSPALAAWIGRKKYGAHRFAELSANGSGHASHASNTYHSSILANAKKRAFTGNHMLAGA